MLKKVLGMSLSLVMIIGMCQGGIGKSANASSTMQSDMNGISMSATEFKSAYSGDPLKRKMTSPNETRNTAELFLSNVVVNEDNVSFRINLKTERKAVVLNADGKIRSSYKNQHGVNSTIIEVDKKVKGYEILLFEICNDTSDNNLLVSGEDTEAEMLVNAPHMKIYLKDKNNEIYLFETEVPEVFENLNARDYAKADKYKDTYWAIDLVEHEEKEIPANVETLAEMGISIPLRGLNSYSTWTNSYIYTDSFYIGSDYVQCYSLPYVEYKHTNVSSSTSTWTAAFKVSEHMSVGSLTYYGNNVFEYHNLKMAFACGDKSTFVRTFQEGRVIDNNAIFDSLKEVGESISVSLLNKAVSALPYGATFQTVLGYLNTLSSASGTVTLGSSGVSLTNRKTTAVGEKLSRYSFEECTDHNGSINNGHYFTYQADIQYEAASGNSSTVGALLVEFDKFYAPEYSYTNISKNFQLNYTSQP